MVWTSTSVIIFVIIPARIPWRWFFDSLAHCKTIDFDALKIHIPSTLLIVIFKVTFAFLPCHFLWAGSSYGNKHHARHTHTHTHNPSSTPVTAKVSDPEACPFLVLLLCLPFYAYLPGFLLLLSTCLCLLHCLLLFLLHAKKDRQARHLTSYYHHTFHLWQHQKNWKTIKRKMISLVTFISVIWFSFYLLSSSSHQVPGEGCPCL